MKKLSYIIIATLAAAVAVSCAKEFSAPVETGDPSMVQFTATTSAVSRTYIKEGHTVWSASDVIKVFSGEGDGIEAKLKWGEDTPKATFEAQVPAASDYYALYPAALASSMPSTGTIDVTLPKVQTGLFSNAHIAVAKGVEKAFAFSNINSFLKITLPEAGYKRIVVESASGKPLSGDLVVTFSGTTPSAVPGTEVNSEVEIASEDGFAAGDVFISVIAGITHDKGLVVKYYDASGLKGGFYLEKEVLTEASTIHSFGEFEVTGEYFATLEGAGNKMGLNAENAMDLAALKAFLTVPEDAESLSAYADALNGATIHLGAGIWDFSDSLAFTYPGAVAPVVVSIVGAETPDTTFVTGADLHRLINVGENANVSFKNIAFINGRGVASGNSPILIEEQATASFDKCIFADCANIKSDDSKATGGCIYTQEESTVYFKDCEFYGNRGSYGANLLVKGKATLQNCRIHDNDGTWPGSALYLDHEDALVIVENSVIEDNTVTKESGKKPDGGAIAVIHGNLTMTGCSILRNSIPTRRGGALRAQNSSKVKLVNCTVKENFADWGGALNIVNDATLEIEGGLYAENTSKGGGCILTGDKAAVIIKDAVFKDNWLNKNGNFGGAIRWESNGPLTITGTSFEGNYTLRNDENEAFGGAVSISYDQNNAEITIDRCSFIGNYGASSGGSALSYQSSGDNGFGWMKVSNTIFKDNYNEYSGDNNNNYGRHAGAVRLGHDATNSYFDNCTFENNYTKTASTEMKSCYGGAVTFYADGNGYFNNCHFKDNRATRGGAISAWNCQISGIFLNGCSFDGNWASYKYGSSIYVSRTKYFCMNNCSINDNTYTLATGEDDGNWVYVDGNAADGDASPDNTKFLEECVISNCSLIGSARSTFALTPMTGQELVYILDLASGAKAYLVNNAIIAAGTDQYSWWTNAVDVMGFNNVYSAKGNTGGSYTASGDTGNKAAADMGSLGWDATDHVWKWNGALAGVNKINEATFAAQIAAGSSQFKDWLEEKGVLGKDQLGNDRGSGDWWPGAYQK
ncbi:MAG: right-handed parallel beta-helix repeat-containing protein [Bacteroidales bacterium]|nr:right-handed parallel beta-helix repeat-containing protein [Bacteroidales bacterium]